MNFKLVILQIYLFSLTLADLTKICAPFKELFTSMSYYNLHEGEFPFDEFINPEFPSRNDLHGEFSIISDEDYGPHYIKVPLVRKGKQDPFTVIVKATRVQYNGFNSASQNVELLKEMSETHPLTNPRFLTCSYGGRYGNLLIMFEELDDTLSYEKTSRGYKDLKKIKPSEVLENILLMSRAVLDIHLQGFSHNAIFQDNIYFLKKNGYRTIKLGDQRILLTDAGYIYVNHKDSWADPVFRKNGKASRWRDVYSLGIALYTLFNESSSIYFKIEDHNTEQYIEECYQQRAEIIQSNMEMFVNENKVKSKFSDVYEQQALELISEIVIGFTRNELESSMDLPARMGLPTAISKIEEHLKTKDPNNIYLQSNMNKLLRVIYPDILADMRTYGQALPSELRIEQPKSSGINIGSFLCMAPNEKAKKVAPINVSVIKNHPQDTYLVRRENLGEIYASYTNPLITIVEPTPAPAKKSIFNFGRII